MKLVITLNLRMVDVLKELGILSDGRITLKMDVSLIMFMAMAMII
jgi:hypothetical protein